jgi:SAM-dependent methyltransferase
VPVREASRQFDRLSSVYDVTRTPMDPAVLERLAGSLQRAGVRQIAEVGVGTGRVALPLVERGLQVTGVDPSAGMLARARAKGAGRWVQGSAYQLPFRDRSFDATLFVHVLHVLEDPVRAVQEATPVSRLGAFAFVRPKTSPSPSQPDASAVWYRVYRELELRGFSVPAARGGGPPVKEQALLERLPPNELEVLRDRLITEPLTDQLEFIASGASRHLVHIPKEALQAVCSSVRPEFVGKSFTYRSVEALARWTAPLRAPAGA